MNHTRFFTSALALVLAVGCVNIGVTLYVKGRQSADEHATCVIQNRGLEAQRHLTRLMGDVTDLLAPRPGAVTPRPIAPVVADLREQIGAYLVIEEAQPKSRSC